MGGYNADIICLQEVDNKIFDFDLLPVLSEHNELDGIFKRKGGQVSEGLACFWRTTKFKQIEWKQFILSDTLQSDKRFENMLKVVKSQEKLSESMLNRTTAINLVALESCVKPNTGLIVATTHLYFRPDADHIRLMQISLCTHHIEEMLLNMNKTAGLDVLPIKQGQISSSLLFWQEILIALHPLGFYNSCAKEELRNYIKTGQVVKKNQFQEYQSIILSQWIVLVVHLNLQTIPLALKIVLITYSMKMI